MKCKYCGKNISRSKAHWITVENDGSLEGLGDYVVFCDKQCFTPWNANYLRKRSRNQKTYYGVKQVPDYNKRCCVVCNAEESHTLSRNECMEFLKITDADLSRVIENGAARRGYTVDVMEE